MPDVFRQLAARLRSGRWSLSAAESATGGLFSERLSASAGASRIFKGSVVAYSIDAKACVLGIPRKGIDRYGPVSEWTARRMARSALALFGSNVAVGITGNAGPGVQQGARGEVWLAAARRKGPVMTKHLLLKGDRKAVRLAAAVQAASLAIEVMDG